MSGIPKSQLNTWSHRGALENAKNTHKSIRNALDEYQDWPEDIEYDVYLQGSYKNHTNIRRDSDVDLVVQLNSTFNKDISALSHQEVALYEQAYDDATYLWSDFRRDVLRALQGYYGQDIVGEGKKTLKLKPHTGLLPADIVVCEQFRKYIQFWGKDRLQFVEGMTFYVPNEARWIVNYPKQHYDNCKNKRESTKGLFKPFVRIFKNIRTYLIDNNVINKGLAPSYFLECLIYNVPGESFQSSGLDNVFTNILTYLSEDLNSNNYLDYICANDITLLFGNEPDLWSISNARTLVSELINLWNNW
jgi:hypothetical protein